MTYNYEKEREEAIYAGKRALVSLHAALDQLNSARNWGIYDMICGGFISSVIKHGKMEKAQGFMEQAKYDLRNFCKELRDVDQETGLNIETNDFLTFADWFFDGFFVDWMVQSRINKAREQISNAIRRVEDVLRQLQA